MSRYTNFYQSFLSQLGESNMDIPANKESTSDTGVIDVLNDLKKTFLQVDNNSDIYTSSNKMIWQFKKEDKEFEYNIHVIATVGGSFDITVNDAKDKQIQSISNEHTEDLVNDVMNIIDKDVENKLAPVQELNPANPSALPDVSTSRIQNPTTTPGSEGVATAANQFQGGLKG